MTAPQSVAEYVRLAREAIAAGDITAATQYKDQAAALKALSPLEETAPRLDFGTGESAGAQTAQSMALKSWYAEAFGGDLDKDGETLMKDLYGSDVRALAHAKSMGFYRFLRTGQMDAMAHKVVMTPAQVMSMIAEGQTFASIKATQIESQDSLGGYLVPEDFRDKVVERIQGLTPMRGIAEAVSTSRDRITMPVITGGDDQYTGSVRVFKVDESPTSTQAATDATFGSVTIPVYTIMGHAAISKNVLEDTTGATSIMGIMQRQFASSFSVFEDREFLIGNGVGGPQGILKDATTGGPYTYAYGSITTVNSGAATALTADSIRAMPYGVATQYRQAGGVWLMSRGTLRVIKTLKAGDGTYLWSSRGDTPALQNGAPPSLEGYPILETETLASPTTNSGSTYTANVYPIVFVCRPMYTIVDKPVGGMAVERYDDSVTAKLNQVVLVIRRRVGGQVINPWAGAVMKVAA
jgi:HK97 family phage major capsid protein